MTKRMRMERKLKALKYVVISRLRASDGSLGDNNVLLLLLSDMKRRRKWRSRNCCISRLVFTTAELQRWSFKPSVQAKVEFPSFSLLGIESIYL